MKNRSIRFLRASLAAACLLAVCPLPAAAYIKVEPLTLGNLCRQSAHIYVLRVEKVSAERGVILFKFAEQLKGKPDGTTAKHVIGSKVEGGKIILDWAAQGKTAVIFCNVERGYGRGHAYIDGYWYWLTYHGNNECWFAGAGEPTWLSQYCGSADKLRDALAKILQGEEVVVPAMVGDIKQDLDQRRAKVQDVRASLKILDSNPKQAPKPSGDKPADDKPADPKKNDNKKPGDKPADDKKPEKPADSKPAEEKKPEKPADVKKPGDVKKPEQGKGNKPEAPPVVYPLPTRDPLPTVAAIDREIDRRLADAKMPASPRADDAEFLRRVTLDITGRIPTLERARAFLDSNDSDKRRKLIDELLSSPEFGQHLGGTWRKLIVPANITAMKVQGDTFTPWLAEQFNRNRPWNDLVYELLTAEGDVRTNPQTGFIMGNAENGQPQPNLLAASATRLFLGVQLQCAECHNHPFTSWKQADFWATAAFFARVRNGGNKGGPPTLTEVLSTQPQAGNKDQVGLPKSTPDGGIVIPASAGSSGGQVVKARFLEGEQPVLDDQPLRPRFAAWATSTDNKFFAPAFVNRVWGQFFGRGFVNPVDNFREDHPASHPELLQLLADEFKASGHDVKHLIRCLCNSQAYQRTSKPLADNETDAELFSHMTVKVLSPAAFIDSLFVVTRPAASGKPVSRDQILGDFRIQEGAEGEFGHGIPQFLRRMNGQEFNGSFQLVDRLAASGMSRDQVIEDLYLAVLARRPTSDERRLMTEYLARQANPGQAYGGVLWILLNSGEFVLNH